MYRFLLTPRWLGWLAGALAVAAVMVLLGLWQLDRYEQRSAINARIDAAAVSEPLPLERALDPPTDGQQVGPPLAADLDWSTVTATGRFDPDHEVLIRARTLSGRVGFEVVTPLVLADGTALLVNRGWIPPADEVPTARPDVPAAPGGQVRVVGRVRPSEPRPLPVEVHEDTMQTRRINAGAFAPHLPYPVYDAQLLLTEPSDPAFTPIPVQHENAWLNGGYAVQWWIFAGMVLVGYGYFARREAKGSGSPSTQVSQPAAEPAPPGRQ